MGSITIYFSLPFFPVQKKTFFYNGHIAIAVNKTVYQLFDSKMLKSDFIVSKMPLKDWLFGKSKKWCHNTNESNQYSHVYLYGHGETHRTKIYYIEINNLQEETLTNIKNQIECIEEQYRKDHISFNFLKFNCSSFVAQVLLKTKIMNYDFFNLIPSILFKNIIKTSIKQNHSFSIGKIDQINTRKFDIHKICIGIFSFNSEKYMDKLINNVYSIT